MKLETASTIDRKISKADLVADEQGPFLYVRRNRARACVPCTSVVGLYIGPVKRLGCAAARSETYPKAPHSATGSYSRHGGDAATRKGTGGADIASHGKLDWARLMRFGPFTIAVPRVEHFHQLSYPEHPSLRREGGTTACAPLSY